MVKLISAALVITALTVPVSLSNLGTPDESAAAEFQSVSNSGQVQEIPQQLVPRFQSQSNLAQSVPPMTAGETLGQSFENPSTVRLADFSGSQQFRNSNPVQGPGTGLRPNPETPSQFQPGTQPLSGLTPIEVDQPQGAANYQNSFRGPQSTAAWQQPQTGPQTQPQFQPPTNPAFQSEFEKRFRSNDAGFDAPGDQRQVPPPATNYNEDPYYNRASATPVPDRSVMQAAWAQQPVSGGFNSSAMQPVQPTSPANTMADLDPSAAKNMLEQLDQFSQTQAMPGSPLMLEEALRQTPSELRTRMVAAYWQTWRDRFLLTTSEQKIQQLYQLDGSGAFGPAGSLDRQLRNAESDVISRKLALRRSQGELKQFFPALSAAEYSPLPVDMPVTAGYDTHYQWYANNGQGNPELKMLDDSLPMVLGLVQEQSDTAIRVARSAERMLQMSMTDQANLDQVIAVLDRAQQTTGDCLESLRQYNATIGDYSLALRPDIQSSFDLARMLVPARRTTSVNIAAQPARTADLRVNVPVRPAENPQSIRNEGFSPSSRNQNFGDGGNRFDPSGSGGSFPPMQLPGSGNLNLAAQPETGNGAMPVQLQPIQPGIQSGFNSPAFEGSTNPASQPLAPRTFQNPGQQPPTSQSFNPGG